jgi:two-component system, sensor histidine kinase PdtaS
MEPLSPEETIKSALKLSATRLKAQHELAVNFAISALNAHRVEAVLQSACEVASKGLRSRLVKVLRYIPDDDVLQLEAGVGWDAADIGSAELSADDASPAGHAYRSSHPVLSNHLGTEHRFRTPQLLVKYGVKRAINVPIRGIPESYGVLEADSADEDDFIETDIVFLEAIANVISMTRERLSAERESGASQLFSTAVLNASNDCILVLTTDGQIEFMNDNGLAQLEIDQFSQVSGSACSRLWPDHEEAKISTAIESAAHGNPSRLETFNATYKGSRRWWDVSVAPVFDHAGQIQRILFAARDITPRQLDEEKLTQLIENQESQLGDSALMMKEMHHRVRNSLQLVQTLLALQGSLSGDKTVATHLQTAATRVMTVASVHERLYREDGAKAADASTYLQGLVEDLAHLAPERAIKLDSPRIILPAERLSPLGFVTAELVTNALKYGRGTVSVRVVAEAKSQFNVIVEDEGDGFPDSFPKPQGTGLGMRLVTTYAGTGPDAVFVDRSVPFGRIVVRFRALRS